MEFQTLVQSIQQIDNLAELRQLGDLFGRQWRLSFNKARMAALKNICIGSSVQFHSRHQGTIRGTVVRINHKTVTVIDLNHEKWLVAPTEVVVLKK